MNFYLRPSVMLDLETFGTESGSAIVQIGACLFGCKPQGHETAFFSERISLQSSLLLGMQMSSATLDWWRGQAPAAKAAIGGEGECVSIKMACTKFIRWFSYWEEHLALGRPDKKLLVWSHGAAFDVPQLEATFKALGSTPPWHYRSVRDTRTLFALAEDAGWNPDTIPDEAFFRNGVKHDAYWDALRQAQDVVSAYAHLTTGAKLRTAGFDGAEIDGRRVIPRSVLTHVEPAGS